MARIVVTRRLVDLSLLDGHEVIVHEQPQKLTAGELAEFVRGADAIISMLSDRIDGRVMDAAGAQLKGIANYAVGYNNIDLAAASTRQIAVGNTPDVLTDATADIAVGLLLAAARHFRSAVDNVYQRRWVDWEPMGFLGLELRGKTIGIIGAGRIGAATARRLHGGWGMRVLYTSRSKKPQLDRELAAKQVDLDELLSESDFVSLHCPATPDTEQLIDAAALRKMKSTAVLINTARGAVVDQVALYQALRERQIFAAGLDVTDPEPLPADSPLRELENCLILPHIGSATVSARQEMARRACRNVLAAVAGQPMPWAVNGTLSKEKG